MRVRPLLASVLAVVALIGLAGCSGSVSVGDKTVDTDELESKVSSFVSKQLEAEPSRVDCPDPLEAKVDATTLCTVRVKGAPTTVRVTVATVDGGRVAFEVAEVAGDGSPLTTAATAPSSTTAVAPSTSTSIGGVPAVAPTELEAQLDAQLAKQFGTAPDDLTCPEALEGTVGATTTCVLTDGSETYDVLLTTKAVDGLDVNFDFEVADTPN